MEGTQLLPNYHAHGSVIKHISLSGVTFSFHTDNNTMHIIANNIGDALILIEEL